MCCKKIARFCVHSNIDGYIGFKKKAVSKIDPPRFSLATMLLKLETGYLCGRAKQSHEFLSKGQLRRNLKGSFPSNFPC